MPLESKDLPIFDIETIAKHNTPEDGWLVIKGGVYNISKFIEFHPGGRSIIEKNLGTDVTEAFMEPTIHTHSEKAWRMLERYKVGTVNAKMVSEESSLDLKLKNAADITKPLVNQVYKMEASLYQTWVHSFPPLTSIRLFESQFFEFFSRYPWWYILPLWIPIVLYNIGIDLLLNVSSPASLISSFVYGVLFWTCLEYVAHRWIFHMDTYTHFGNFFHFMAHGIHHLSPMDPDRLTFPPIFSVFIVALVYKSVALFPIPNLNTFFAGGLAGYVMYDTMHYFFHHGTVCDNNSYLKWMRSRHFRHHYVCPDKNFGVSFPMWDYVFGTAE